VSLQKVFGWRVRPHRSMICDTGLALHLATQGRTSRKGSRREHYTPTSRLTLVW
jgi:hypothetical protein